MKSALLRPRDPLMSIPAFPTFRISNDHDSGVRTEEGMELRDYLATRAMVVAFAHHPEYKGTGWDPIANTAYAIADAMMMARKRR